MTPAPEPTESTALGGLIRDALAGTGLAETSSAFVLDLARLCYGAHDADANIYPASVIKVAIMAHAFARRARGDFSFDDRVAISNRNLTTTAESTPLAAGYQASVGELVRLMIERSDNIATNQLIALLGRSSVTGDMTALGLRDFFLGRKLSGSEPLVDDPEMTGTNRFNAHDAGRLLMLIATDSAPGAAEQRRILRECVHNDKLTPGLQPGDVFMHKTGETSTVNHDAGILTTVGGPQYVVVLYTRSDQSNNAQMAAWMRAVRQSL